MMTFSPRGIFHLNRRWLLKPGFIQATPREAAAHLHPSGLWTMEKCLRQRACAHKMLPADF